MARFTKFAFLAGILAMWAPIARAQDDPAPMLQTPDLPPFHWFASTDSRHRNADYVLLKPGETRRVPLAAGELERLWSTALEPEKLILKLENGAPTTLLANGQAKFGILDNRAYTFFPSLRGGFQALQAGAALIATNAGSKENKWFYQAAVRPLAKAPPVVKARQIDLRQFPLTLAPGEIKTLDTWDSPGMIYEVSVASREGGKLDFHKIRLRAGWDGQGGIDAPLFSLAGQEAGQEMINNQIAEFDGTTLLLRWPMPFEKAKLALQNEGGEGVKLEVAVRVRHFNEVPSPYRFCAVQRTAQSKKGVPVEILKVAGQGAFLGLGLSISPGDGAARRTFAFLEGNETLTADGAKFEGTGTEDFFSSAWYFPEKPFSHPFEGLTQKIALPPQISAFRLMIPDAVPFKKSFRFDFEHGNGNNTDGMKWQWTAFWLQKPPLSLPASDAPAPVAAEPTAEIGRTRSKAPIFAALGAGVVVGVLSAFFRRRRARKK